MKPKHRQHIRSLIEMAQQLRNEGLDAALEAYKESSVSMQRVIGAGVAVAWLLLWFFLGPGDAPKTPKAWNYPQALAALPAALTIFAISSLWAVIIRRGWLKDSMWLDALGAAASILGVSLLLYRAWDLMIAFVCYLPMICITVGARFNRPIFYATILVCVIATQVAAPHNYWFNRPHFAFFALTLIVLMPLSIVRLLNTIRTVSEVAIRSRDAQSRFVATMSHEFRTPLNSVINNAVLIDSDDMPESQKRIVAALTNGAMALRYRVNEVLDVRAIEAGALTLVVETFRISALLKTIREMTEPAALAKNVRIDIETPGDVAEIVLESDPTRLEQVITNLLTNAVKFTPDGGNVAVRVERGGPDVAGRVPVQITVTDTGPGISDDELASVWLPFHQLSSGSARRHGGVGLGLYLVKSILSYLGGKIDYARSESGGSIFTVRLLLKRAAPGVVPASSLSFREAAAEHRRQTRSMRCLVIDDAPVNLETIDRLLAIAGHSMIGARSGQEGIDKARQEKIDVILLDLHMPDLTGYDVLRELASIGITTPVYMLSADAGADAMRQTQALGAVGYLTKPINYVKLLALLETVADGVAGGPAPVAAVEPLTGMAFVEEMAGEDAAREFAIMLVAELDAEYDVLRKAFEAREFDVAGFAAHSLKNVFLNVGSTEGGRVCEDLRAELRVWNGGASSAALDRLAGLVQSTRQQLIAANT